MSIGLILMIVALLLFILAAANVASKVNLIAAGLACLTLAMIAGSAVLHG